MKRIIFTILLLSISILSTGCGATLRSMFGIEDTAQCQQMETVCSEASHLRRENRKYGIKKDPLLVELERRCQQANCDCNNSQPPVQKDNLNNPYNRKF